jgi:predicted transcriptional regulator
MKNLSLKLDDKIFGETEEILTKINKPRNRYINEAIDFYNNSNKENFLRISSIRNHIQ